jgi:HNH endonuclease
VKYLLLTRGVCAKVDDEDYERLRKYKWHVSPSKGNVYAARCRRVSEGPGPQRVLLHYEALGLKNPISNGRVIDHKNRDGLDCRKRNLRVCSQSENAANRGPNRSGRNPSGRKTSKYKGIYWMAAHGYHPAGWVAKIRHREKRFYLGFFKKEYDAVQEYNRAAYKLYGQFAYLNEWDGPTGKEK